jgi:hypothetical protein
VSEQQDNQERTQPPPGDAPLGEYYDAEADIRYYFDETIVQRRATCEGGAPIEGSNTAARVTYVGFTTGRRFDQGNPPWKWIEMIGRDPDSPAEQQLVWCEEAFLFFEDEDD